MTKKEDRFYSKWEKLRKRKWRYIFLHGVIYWGFSVATISFLLDSRLKFENMHFSNLISALFVFGIAGIGYGLWKYKRFDSIFFELKNSDGIEEAITSLESGESWSYESLKIELEKEGRLIVKNLLFWYEKTQLSPLEINECFNLLMSDFRRLEKNPRFKEFIKNKRITIQIHDNSESGIPLIEKNIQ